MFGSSKATEAWDSAGRKAASNKQRSSFGQGDICINTHQKGVNRAGKSRRASKRLPLTSEGPAAVLMPPGPGGCCGITTCLCCCVLGNRARLVAVPPAQVLPPSLAGCAAKLSIWQETPKGRAEPALCQLLLSHHGCVVQRLPPSPLLQEKALRRILSLKNSRSRMLCCLTCRNVSFNTVLFRSVLIHRLFVIWLRFLS